MNVNENEEAEPTQEELAAEGHRAADYIMNIAHVRKIRQRVKFGLAMAGIAVFVAVLVIASRWSAANAGTSVLQLVERGLGAMPVGVRVLGALFGIGLIFGTALRLQRHLMDTQAILLFTFAVATTFGACLVSGVSTLPLTSGDSAEAGQALTALGPALPNEVFWVMALVMLFAATVLLMLQAGGAPDEVRLQQHFRSLAAEARDTAAIKPENAA